MKHNTMNRRRFLGEGVRLGLAGLAMPYAFPPDEKETQKVVYRTLGKTGLKVSEVGYGCMLTRDPEVIRSAVSLGINYFDTARRYMDGYNEVVVGEALATCRKEVILATKILPNSRKEKEIFDSFHASLKALKTDYVDVIQLHSIQSVEAIRHEESLKTLDALKKSGKARFVGFTTHTNQVELLQAAVDKPFFDVILVAYNFKSPPELGVWIQKAAEAGIGIVAMKTQAGGYAEGAGNGWSAHQAALKWVLHNPGVHTAIPSMPTYEQLEENIKAMGSRMGWWDRFRLEQYGQRIDRKLCRMCGACRGQCPKGVAIPDINRALMYYEGYDDEALARATLAEISFTQSAARCRECDSCPVVCPFGLHITDQMACARGLMEMV